MWRRKITAAAAAAMMAAALVTFPAAAHGHGHHRQAAVTTDTSCPVCTVEGCAESGRHTHDGHDYCGYNHSSGYCDGSCQTASSTASGYGGCHGCHR